MAASSVCQPWWLHYRKQLICCQWASMSSTFRLGRRQRALLSSAADGNERMTAETHLAISFFYYRWQRVYFAFCRKEDRWQSMLFAVWQRRHTPHGSIVRLDDVSASPTQPTQEAPSTHSPTHAHNTPPPPPTSRSLLCSWPTRASRVGGDGGRGRASWAAMGERESGRARLDGGDTHE